MARVALSGRVDGLGRAGFRELVHRHGHTYASSLEEGVDLLVVGEEPLASKVARARALDIEVVSVQAFREQLGQGAARPEAPVHTEAAEASLPSIERQAERVRILDLWLPRRAVLDDDSAARVPTVDELAHYTLDAPTLRQLRFVARAVRLRHPCLLEGDTATSKTSAVRFVAALLGQPVVRVNLDGQTDATELVGRYVPDGDGWRFQEGPVPLAMRHGWWLVLDEVNLAEPAVLERLNPVLERVPSLLLSEGDGTRFGPGGVPVHESFRVFATMNPAEYQGRSVLSPAWRDRFVATYQARAPGELELRQLLEWLVFARQPEVEVDGAAWLAPEALVEAPFASLQGVAGMGTLLSRVAALHAAAGAMADAARGQGAALGAQRRERYVFTRRGLLAFLDALATLRLVDPHSGREQGLAEAPTRVVLDALEQVYVEPLAGDEDRGRMRQLLRSLGLSRDQWVDPFHEEA
jgi:MoxR-like ATPase